MENASALKALSGKAAPAKGSAVGSMMSNLKKLPGVEPLAKAMKTTKPKQYVDICIFAVGIYLMYRFGKAVADQIDLQMPTEKSMMDMMK